MEKNKNEPMTVSGCSIGLNGKSFILDSSLPGYYEVAINFEHLNGARSLFLLKNGLNYAAGSAGYLSLNPNGGMVELPVLAMKFGNNVFDFKVLRNKENDNSVSLISCAARKFKVNWQVFNPVPDFRPASAAFDLTDSNWIGGVGKSFSAIFVLNNEINRDEFLQGRSIRFSTREVRKIDHVMASGSYLNIFLDGEPLDGQLVGYPNKFEVLK